MVRVCNFIALIIRHKTLMIKIIYLRKVHEKRTITLS